MFLQDLIGFTNIEKNFFKFFIIIFFNIGEFDTQFPILYIHITYALSLPKEKNDLLKKWSLLLNSKQAD